MTADYDVAIVGAGLAGSTLAAAIAKSGWKVLLLEKDGLPRHKVCGEFLSPESQQTLKNLELFESVATLKPAHLTSAVIVNPRGSTLQIELPMAAWGISRYALDQVLVQAAQNRGALLMDKCFVRNIECHNSERGCYQIAWGRTNDPITATTHAVVLASGRNTSNGLKNFGANVSANPFEKVMAKVPRPPKRASKRFVGIKAHFHNIRMPNRTELYLFDGGYVGINPVEDGRANVSLLARYDALERAGRTPTGLLHAIGAENPQFAHRLVDAGLIDDSLCTVAPVHTNAPSQPWSGMACVGDVATMIPPLCGDGMAMALRSAELCAPLLDRFLTGEISEAEWQRSYVQLWHSEFDWRLRAGRLLQYLLNRRGSADLLLRLGNTLPALASLAFHATRGPMNSELIRI